MTSDWIEIRCPKCEGKGEVFKLDYFTTGVMPLDPGRGKMHKCETCRGVGALLARPIEMKPIEDHES